VLEEERRKTVVVLRSSSAQAAKPGKWVAKTTSANADSAKREERIRFQ
jgi:hypothetical protein